MTCFTGIWVPLVTPFHHVDIDFPALKKLARRMTDAGAAGLVVCGTTSEAAALDDAEQMAVLDAVIDAVPDCQVIMGLGGNHMPSVLKRLRHICERPVAGLLVPPPCYIRPSQAGLIEYFTSVADTSAAPILLYNIPYRAGVDLTLPTIRTLAQHENIVAIKDCGGNPQTTTQLIHDGQLDVLAGEDHQLFSTLCLGGSGAIAASAHIRTDLFVRVAQLLQAGRLHEARSLFKELAPMIQLLFAEPNPAAVKAVLADLGWISNELRPPMQRATEALQQQLRAAMQQLAAIEP